MFKKSMSKSRISPRYGDESDDHIPSLINKANPDYELPSHHVNMITQYMETTKFESIMTSAFREVFEGDLIPKNPYPKLIRALNTANTQKQVLRNFNERLKYVTRNITAEEGPFGITSIKSRPIFFGLKHILEWLDVDRLAALRKGLLEFLPDYRDEVKDTRIVVSASIGGGYLMHSNVLPYPESAPAPLEISAEVFIEADNIQNAMELFTHFVYDDISSITNIQAYHIFRYFKIEFYDDQTRKDTVKIWNIQDITAKQKQFLYDIQRATLQRKKFFMKIFLKTQKINFTETEDAIRDRKLEKSKNPNHFIDAQFDKNFLFVDTTKYYNFHYIEKGRSQTSYCFHPMRSLLRGVFLDELVAQKYAAFFYKENEKYITSKAFKGFIDAQLAFILPKWRDQNLLYSAWEFFYIALTVENEELRRKLIDNLIQLLSSEYAYLYATSRVNKVLIFLVIAYRLKTFPFYKFAANETFKIYCSILAEILARGNTSEVIIFREFIQRALSGITDPESKGIDIHMDTNRILKSIYRLTRAVAESNLQIASIYVKNLSDFMYQTFVKAKILDQKEMAATMTYEESLRSKAPKRVLHISGELKASGKGPKDAEFEERLFLHYINEYELYDYLFLTIQEIFFNPQIPNPIPLVSFRMEYQSYKFQLREVPSERLKSLLNDPGDHQLLNFRNITYPNIYNYTNEFMHSQALPSIIGLKELLLVTGVNECSSLKTYIDNLNWKKAITKANPNYEVADIFTINLLSMVSHASIVKRRYAEWVVNYDFVMKGPSLDKAAEVFFDIFLRYAQWLESVEDVHVLGFYDGMDAPKAFMDINMVLKNFSTPEPRNLLRNYFANNRRVMLKFISVVEGHFKVIGMYLNMHFLEATNTKPKSLLETRTLDDMVKLFFKPEDFVMWNKIYPFNREETLKLLEEQMKYMKIVGKLNYAYKLEIIRAALDEDSKLLLKLFRGLFGTAEPFYLAAKEAEALRCAFEILEKIKNNEQVIKKLEMRNTIEFFDDFKDNLTKKLLVYHNYNLEGVHAKILNLLGKIDTIYSTREGNYEACLDKIEKIILYCFSVGDIAYLSFEKSVFEKDKLRVVL